VTSDERIKISGPTFHKEFHLWRKQVDGRDGPVTPGNPPAGDRDAEIMNKTSALLDWIYTACVAMKNAEGWDLRAREHNDPNLEVKARDAEKRLRDDIELDVLPGLSKLVTACDVRGRPGDKQEAQALEELKQSLSKPRIELEDVSLIFRHICDEVRKIVPAQSSRAVEDTLANIEDTLAKVEDTRAKIEKELRKIPGG
jgi:hypothetical protein